MGLARGPPRQVEDGIGDGAAGVQALRERGGERRGAGPAARAAAPDGEPRRIGRALRREGAGHGGTVLDVDDAPLLPEAVAVRTSVAGGAAVVDLRHTDAARGEVGDLQIEHQGGAAGGPAVHPHHVGRQFPRGCGVVGMVRGVQMGVDVAAVGPVEGTALRLRIVGRVHLVLVVRGHGDRVAGAGVQFDDLVGGAGARRDPGDAGVDDRERGRPLGPRPGGVDQFARLRVEHTQPLRAPPVQRGHESAGQRCEPALPDLPGGARELLLARAQRHSPGCGTVRFGGLRSHPAEVPPAARVGGDQQRAVGGELRLRHRLLGAARDRTRPLEAAVSADPCRHHAGAVPRHRGVVPRQPDQPLAVRGEPRTAQEPVAVPGQLPDPAAVGGGRTVQRDGRQHPAQFGGALAGELLQYAPHLAALEQHHRIAPAQPVLGDVGERGQRAGARRSRGRRARSRRAAGRRVVRSETISGPPLPRAAPAQGRPPYSITRLRTFQGAGSTLTGACPASAGSRSSARGARLPRDAARSTTARRRRIRGNRAARRARRRVRRRSARARCRRGPGPA